MNNMKDNTLEDVNGDKISEGDFCLFSTNVGGINYGMLCGKRYININGSLCYFCNAYKLFDEYLKPYEKEYKAELQKQYDQHYNKLKVRKNVKHIGMNDMKSGCIYVTINGDAYVYYGYGTVISHRNESDDKQETGYIYLRAGYVEFKSKTDFTIVEESIEKYILFDMDLAISLSLPLVLKTRKNFVAKANYAPQIFKKEFEYRYCDEYNPWHRRNPYKENRLRIEFFLD